MNRACIKCSFEKPLESFPVIKGTSRRRTECRKCRAKQASQWRADPKNSGMVRAHKLKDKFGITPEEYERLLYIQNYRCAICEKKQLHVRRRLAVDHDHKTGKIRGLLCTGCNPALGGFGDNPETLRRAAYYLERSR